MKLYGVRADDIHTWMDAPSAIYGSSHRWTRHDLGLVPKKFLDKYGEELAKQIMLDHILLDRKDDPRVKLTVTGSRVTPVLDLKKEVPIPTGIILVSFLMWGFSLLTLLPTGGNLIYLWAAFWLLWWLGGWRIAVNASQRRHVHIHEKTFLEEHK